MGSLVRRRWLALLVALLPLALPAAAQDSPATDSWLVVLQGDVVSVAGDRLDLNADPHSIGFTDRPERLVRFIDTEGFVSRSWGTGGVFAIDPPNASLIGENGTLAIVELTAALWSDGRLGLDFVLLEGDLPAPGDRAVLTIDTVACCDTLQCWDPNTCPQA
jgi:hypothetical protein